jgi:aspartyl-tRNA(Asn)/glutamyl-tRNA(Gln) amidotransferase subunit C
MSKLSRDDILKLASLSRLRLTNDEVEEFTNEISKILDYVETLKKVDTKGLPPTYQVTGLKNVTREDKALDYQAKPDDILALSPDIKEKQYKVKRVL